MATATRPPTRTEPPREPPGPAPPRRRAIPAGHVVVVALVAVIVGSFLNAQGLRKMAYTQPEGWRRDVGMAFTAPLVDIAGVLRLDQPREGLKQVLGRGEDDRIATEVVLPPPSTGLDTAAGVAAPAGTDAEGAGTGAAEGPAGTGADADAAKAPPKPKPVFTPERPMELWIAGDSLSIVPGEALLRLTAGNDAVKPVGADKGVEGRLATGLERPDRYDWFTRIQKEMKKENPDVVVLTFGSNDMGGYMTGLPEGEEKAAFGTPEWLSQYRARVAGVMDLVTGAPRRTPRLLVWIGVPIVNDEGRNEQYKTINAVIRAEADRRAPKVAYVDTYRRFRTDGGGFAQRLPDEDGKLQEVRSPDGLHFEPAGGDIVARAVMKRIEAVFELRDAAPATDDPPPGT